MFPVVEIGQKFAASLLVSTITDEVLNDLKMPWPAFMLSVPEGLLETWDPNSKTNIPICKIFAAQSTKDITSVPNSAKGFVGNWMFFATTKTPISLWRFGVTPAGLMMENNEFKEETETHESMRGVLDFSLETTDLDSRVSGMIGKLIVTTCIALTMKELVSERQHRPKNKHKKQNTQEPEARIYTVGKPTVIDFRERVKQYLRGERRSKDLEVQHMVQGHFKRQPFGKNRVERKTIWIEPYYRGPEDAAIAIHPHILETEKGTSVT
jgi:hypothetical protein